MREILFRGKSKAQGSEWLYGDVLIYENSAQIWETIDNRKYNSVVSLETVGQYTGLIDKNGKKIFEGDIVAGAVHWLERMKNGVVVFRDGSFGLLWHRGEVEQFAPFTSLCNVEYEVIGNIHDNSDLLEGGE